MWTWLFHKNFDHFVWFDLLCAELRVLWVQQKRRDILVLLWRKCQIFEFYYLWLKKFDTKINATLVISELMASVHKRRKVHDRILVILAVVTDRKFSSAELFGRTSTVRFGTNDRTFFCKTQNFFFVSHSMPMAFFLYFCFA